MTNNKQLEYLLFRAENLRGMLAKTVSDTLDTSQKARKHAEDLKTELKKNNLSFYDLLQVHYAIGFHIGMAEVDERANIILRKLSKLHEESILSNVNNVEALKADKTVSNNDIGEATTDLILALSDIYKNTADLLEIHKQYIKTMQDTFVGGKENLPADKKLLDSESFETAYEIGYYLGQVETLDNVVYLLRHI